MSVLAKETNSIDCFVQNRGKKPVKVKGSKNTLRALFTTIRELTKVITFVPTLRCININHHDSAVLEKMGLLEKRIRKCRRISIKKAKITRFKNNLPIHKSTFCSKADQMEKAFRELFLSSPCPMALISVDTRKVITANDHFVKLAGQDHETILKWSIHSLKDMISPRDYHYIRKSLLQQQSVKDYKCRFDVKSQNANMILLNIKYLMFNEQNMLLLTVVDISETIELKQHIERLSCLNLVGQLAASIGHEIRNPMTTVRGYLRYMQRKSIFSGFAEQFSMMICELDRANEIITDFLTLAKNRVNGSAMQNLNKIVEDIGPLMEAMGSEIGHSIEFVLQPIPDLLVDKIDIHKVLINLVKNGFEAMDDKGKVVVSTFKEEHYIVLQVTDEGKGISKEVLEKLGTPFFTTKEKGTGLGLSVCYQIAARHNAFIDIQTNTAGSTFSLKFPYKK